MLMCLPFFLALVNLVACLEQIPLRSKFWLSIGQDVSAIGLS